MSDEMIRIESSAGHEWRAPGVSSSDFASAMRSMSQAVTMSGTLPMVEAEIARRRRRNPLKWLWLDVRDWLKRRAR